MNHAYELPLMTGIYSSYFVNKIHVLNVAGLFEINLRHKKNVVNKQHNKRKVRLVSLSKSAKIH